MEEAKQGIRADGYASLAGYTSAALAASLQRKSGRQVSRFVRPSGVVGQHAIEAKRDRERDAWLAERDVTVLRFWNSDITENISGVLETIAAEIAELQAAQSEQLALPDLFRRNFNFKVSGLE